MRAKTVNEDLNFERGQDPKSSMQIGRNVPVKMNDKVWALNPDTKEEEAVIAISDEIRNVTSVGNKGDETIEKRYFEAMDPHGEVVTIMGSDWYPGEWTILYWASSSRSQ